MKVSRRMPIVLLLMIILAALSSFAVHAIEDVTLSVPGDWEGFPSVCGDDSGAIAVTIHMTPSSDDGGGADYFGFVTYDGNGTIIDAYVTSEATSAVAGDSVQATVPGYNGLPNPAARPFTFVVYEITTPYDTNPHTGAEIRDFILSNGSEEARTTYDPSFVPACAELPLVGGACIAIPDGSVVGDMPYPTQAYYSPGNVSPGVIINPGTYWVIGEDESGEYYQIILACQYLWVPVDSMQPSYESPQNGAALPTRVVTEGGESTSAPR